MEIGDIPPSGMLGPSSSAAPEAPSNDRIMLSVIPLYISTLGGWPSASVWSQNSLCSAGISSGLLSGAHSLKTSPGRFGGAVDTALHLVDEVKVGRLESDMLLVELLGRDP